MMLQCQSYLPKLLISLKICLKLNTKSKVQVCLISRTVVCLTKTGFQLGLNGVMAFTANG